MNRFIYYRMVVPALLCLLICSCKPAAEKKEEKAEEKSGNAEAGLKIEAETQAKIGLKVEPISASEFTPSTKYFGHVVDPAPLNAALNEIRLAKASLVASEKEFERVKVLREQNNASDRTLETAEAALEKDRLTLQSASEKLQLAWGKEISGRRDLEQLVQRLTAGSRSLVRIDFPMNEKPITPPNHIRISIASENIDGELVGNAPTIDLPTQGRGLFYLVAVGIDKLPVGSTVTAEIPRGAATVKGFTIPAAAIIFHDGERWFYLQEGDTQFHRERIVNAESMASGYFVTNGVEVGARVVTSGAQQLLSEELKSQIAPD